MKLYMAYVDGYVYCINATVKPLVYNLISEGSSSKNVQTVNMPFQNINAAGSTTRHVVAAAFEQDAKLFHGTTCSDF